MTDRTELRLLAMQEATRMLHAGIIDIKDGDYDLFNMAENIYNFIVMEGDKFGIKNQKRKQEVTPVSIFELLAYFNENFKNK